MTREPLQERVANLEMLLMHMQRDAEEMNKALLQQGRQVDQLQRLVQRLAQGHSETLAQQSPGDADMEDETSFGE